MKLFPRYPDIAALTAVFLVSRAMYYRLGLRFDDFTMTWFLQFIDPVLLKTRLLESILYLHSSPPVLNLYTGIVLKIFGSLSHTVFLVSFLCLGLALTLAMYQVMKRLGVPPGVAFAVTVLFAASPASVLYENWLMYTHPTASFLVLSAWSLMKYADTKRLSYAAAFFVLLMLIALTRGFFHISWLCTVTAGVLLFSKGSRRRIASVALIPVLMVFLWYGKNAWLFGSFSCSSLLGLSLTNITTLQVPKPHLNKLVDEGKLSPMALVSRYKGLSYMMRHKTYRRWGVPVLDDLTKANGKTNFNHISFIENGRIYARDALTVAWHFPNRYLSGVALAHRQYFSSSTCNTYFTRSNLLSIRPIDRLYNPIVYGASPTAGTIAQPHFGPSRYRLSSNTGYFLMAGIPLMFLYFTISLIRIRHMPDRRTEAAVLVYLLFNLLYGYVIGSWIELGENYRYRYLLEPFTFILLGLLVRDLFERFTELRAKKENAHLSGSHP